MEQKKSFVAINYISCKDHYKPRFEELFSSRAKAIDKMPGFINMEVLKPEDGKSEYLIVSHWKSKEAFSEWTKSPEFIEGHKRGFEDLKIAKEKGDEMPMSSDFKTYTILTT
ncbi:MAG: Heme oxygenase (staphylobilin-producing) [Ignavibacteria bacterium]|nr:Heme oxygenase (staphylobilin-producing) [Ignavibacteria bacterium]